jgi:hypothetical protein
MKNFSLYVKPMNTGMLDSIRPPSNNLIERNSAEELKEATIASNFLEAYQYLKELLRSEEVIQVEVKLVFSSFLNNLSYAISVSYKNGRYNTEKTLEEIASLHSHLKYLFPSIRSPEVPTPPNNASAIKTEELANWLQMIINDVDLMCTGMREFFGFDFMKVFDWVHELIHESQSQEIRKLRSQLNVLMIAEVPLYKLEIESELSLVFHVKLVMKFDRKVYSWEINKKYT